MRIHLKEQRHIKNLLNEAGTYSSELQLTIVQSKSQTKRVSTEGRGLLMSPMASFASMGDDTVMIIFQLEDYASPVVLLRLLQNNSARSGCMLLVVHSPGAMVITRARSDAIRC